jgi:hypothetical protein
MHAQTTTGPEITARGEVTIDRFNGSVTWKVTEFDGGRNYMLVADCGAGCQFAAHFDREQWDAFQKFVVGF